MILSALVLAQALVSDSARYIVVPDAPIDSVQEVMIERSIGVELTRKGDFFITYLKLNEPAKIYQLYIHPLIARVELDYQLRSPAPVETSQPLALSWGVAYIRADQIPTPPDSVTVGIIDSGIDSDHPLLVSHIAGGYDATGGGNWEDNNTGCNGHGTHVAGTVVDVNPSAKVFALKVFPSSGECLAWASDQIEAMNYARDHGIWVVNISIGGSSALASYNTAIINYARLGGILVAATGNSGGAVLYPGGYSYAIGVGAITSSGSIASYSSRGPEVDVVAPGSGIVSTLPGGRTGSKSGTSMASPHIAGVVSLLKARFPSLTVRDIHYIFSLTAKDGGTAGRDNTYGWGRVDAFAADSFLIANPNYHAPAPTFPIAVINQTWGANAVADTWIDSMLINNPSDAYTLTYTPRNGLFAYTRKRYVVWNVNYTQVAKGSRLVFKLEF